MQKIIFVCHGNICRSPVGEILFNKYIKEKGLDKEYFAISRATSYEEINNDIYPPMKRVLNSHKIIYSRHYATRITKQEFDEAEYIFYMDNENLYYLERMFNKSDKFVLISKFFDNKETEDPWYTDRFEYVFDRIDKSVKAIVEFLASK